MRAVPRIGLDRGERLTPIREVERSSQGYVLTGRDAARAVAVDEPLLSVRDLTKTYAVRKSGLLGSKADAPVRALDGVSFDIRRGECLGLVGESGCGKTTVSKILMRVVEPDAGEATYHEAGGSFSLFDLEGDALTAFRRRAQYVFQDPVSSLNPRMTVFDIISEPLVIHGIGDRAERAAIVQELMGHVGLDPRFLSRYPHSFSGGQRSGSASPGARPQPGAHHLRRARLRSRRLGAGAGPEPAEGSPVRARADVPVHLAQPRGRRLHGGPHRGDVRGPPGGGRAARTAVREPGASVHRALLAAVPRTDPSARLDLGALMEGKVSSPAEWPEPFTVRPGARSGLVEIAPGHSVRTGGELPA